MRTYVYAVPDGVPAGGQILVTIWSDEDLRKDSVPAGDYQPEDRYEVATRGPAGFGLRVWGPPLELEAKG